MSRFREKYIGDRKLYKYALGIALPMILQNLITNLVAMLDNLMVGQIGTAQMSGVSIVNQLIFIFNLTIFGGLSGASIFGTQFFGKGDHEGQMYTFRFRLYIVLVILISGIAIFKGYGPELIRLFLSDGDAPELIEQTLGFGTEYLSIMVWTLIPFSIGQCYANTIRECGQTKVPMIASFIALFANLFLDYAMIFGKFGFPELGVKGAAIATLIAKIIEALVMIFWAHSNYDKNPYLPGAYKSVYIPGYLVADICKKGVFLLINEFLWSFGTTVIAQAYSVRGLEVVAARNIAGTLTNLFNVVFVQLGVSIGIIVGMRLGAGKLKEARDISTKLIAFSMACTLVMALLTIPVAYVFPRLYNTESAVMELATYFILVAVVAMPIWAFANNCYFILRSGGKTGITFLFDFGATWLVMIPLAVGLSRFTNMDIRPLYTIVTLAEAIKVVVGYFMIKSDIWMVNIVDGKN